MSLFGNMSSEGLEEAQDRLGGGYSAKETDIYTTDLKLAYAGKSSGGANSMTFVFSGGDLGNDEYRETVYFTNRKGDNFFLAKDKDGKETGKKAPLPGFTVVNDIFLATIGKELNTVEFEEKTVNIYDYDAKKELPKAVMVPVEALGTTVSIAIVKTTENQTEKSGDDYVPKADGSTRDVNHIDKVFNTKTKMTIAEAKGGATEGQFWEKWLEKNKGKTVDKVKKLDGQSGRPPAAGGSSNAGGSPRQSLFG